MSNLITFKLPGLLNSEYPLTVNRLISITEEHNPEALHLKTAFDRVAAFRPQLAKIEVQERSDSDSALLHALDHERDTLLNGIRTVVEAFSAMPVEAVHAPAAKIMALFDKHGADIARDNYTAETKRIYDLVADIKEQPDLMTAFEALSLTLPGERLEAVNKEFDRVFMHRTRHQAETDRVNVREIRNKCDKAITKLWVAIEYNIDEHGEKAYRPLVAAINTFNGYYRQQLAVRATRRKNGKDASKEEPIIPQE